MSSSSSTEMPCECARAGSRPYSILHPRPELTVGLGDPVLRLFQGLGAGRCNFAEVLATVIKPVCLRVSIDALTSGVHAVNNPAVAVCLSSVCILRADGDAA